MNTKKILSQLSFLLLICGLFFIGVKIVEACSNGKWKSWTDSSTCVASNCGTNQGTKTQIRSCESHNGSDQCNPGREVCDKDCPTVTFSASHQIIDVPAHYGNCPTGFVVDPEHDNKCVKWHDTSHYTCPNGYTLYGTVCKKHNHPDVPATWVVSGYYGDSQNRSWVADTYKTETFGPINVVYGNKSADGNHCHRPTGESLGVPSWAMDEFNDLPEHKNTINVNCRYEGVESQTQVVACNNAPVIDCPTATPTEAPVETQSPEVSPTATPDESVEPTATPTVAPTVNPTEEPSYEPTPTETPVETQSPEDNPTSTPNESVEPTATPTMQSEETPTATATPTTSSGIGGTSTDSGTGGGNPGAPSCNDAKPQTPYLLSAISLGGESIKVSWQKVTDPVTDYSIYYGPSTGNYLYSVVNTGNTDNYIVNGLSSGCFALRAVNGCATSDLSNEVCTSGTGGSQVLGASTLGATGSFTETFSELIFALGSILTMLGIGGTSFKKNFNKER